MNRLASPPRRVLPLRPNHRQNERNANSDRHLGKPVKGSLPGWANPRDQQHNGQRNAPKPVCTSICQGKRAKQSQEEHASAKHQNMRPEVTRHNGPNRRSKRRPDETLPGYLQRRSQRRLCNHNGCDWCPVCLWQPEQACHQHRSNRCHSRTGRMHQYYPTKQPLPQPYGQNAPVLPNLPNLPVPASPLPSSSSTIPQQSRHALAQVHTLDRSACKKSGCQTTPNNDFCLTNSKSTRNISFG